MIRSYRTQFLIILASFSILFLVVIRVSYRERGDSSLLAFHSTASGAAASLRSESAPPLLHPSMSSPLLIAAKYGNKMMKLSKGTMQQQAIMKFCARHPELRQKSMSSVYKHLLHEDKYGLVYCFVPKVGCTSLKPVIERLSGAIELPVVNATELERRVIHGKNTRKVALESLTQEEREQVLHTHFKFMVLRDPVERMLSAYKDKLEVPLSEDKAVASSLKRRIISDLMKNTKKSFHVVNVEQDGKQIATLPFADYLYYLLHTPLESLDQHFMPMHLLCNPCAVDYNFYGNFRTLTDDVHHVLSQVGAPEELYEGRTEHSQVNMRDFLDLYYGRMTSEARKQMKEKMATITGYTFEAAPKENVPRQLIVEVFQKFSTEFDFYYSVFPAEERTFNRYAKGLNL